MRKSPYYRNQRGMAMWLKVLLCIFALGLLSAIVGSICLVSFFKDMTDPLKTEATANKIVTMAQPIPPPFEYGPMNISMFGYAGALIKNTSTDAMFFVIKVPKKQDQNAKEMMEKVAKGEAGLPDPSQASPGSDSASSKTNMNVESRGELTCGGKPLYYVIGKAVAKRLRKPGASGEANEVPVEMSTFLGGADGRDPQSLTFVMGQQQNPAKTLTMDEVKDFLGTIKEI